MTFELGHDLCERLRFAKAHVKAAVVRIGGVV